MYPGDKKEDLISNWGKIGKDFKDYETGLKIELLVSWIELSKGVPDYDYNLMEGLREQWKSFYKSVKKIILSIDKDKPESGRKLLI